MSARKTSGRAGWMLILLLATAVVIATLGSYKVWYHYQTVGIGYHLADEIVRHRELFDKNRKLALELESLEREQLRLMRTSEALRMRPPEPGDYVVVTE